MNPFLELQCRNMICSVRVFVQACELAARKDDGRISEDEKKVLQAIRAAADTFLKELHRIAM